MTARLRAAGPPIVLASPLTIGATYTVSGAGGTYTGTGAVVAHRTIAAGRYAFGDFVVLLWQTLRQWIFDDLNAGGSSATISGGVDAVDLRLDVAATATWGETRVSLRLELPTVQVGGQPAPLTALTLLNNSSTAQAPFWPSLLGLGQEGSSVAVSVAGGVATLSGPYQPRALYCFLRSEVKPAGSIVTELSSLLPTSDGLVGTYEIHSGLVEQEWSLVAQPAEICGDPQPVGVLASLSASRLVLNCPNPRRSGGSGNTGVVAGTGLDESRLPLGAYVGITAAPGLLWVSRVKSITLGTAPASHQVELWERVPSTHSPLVGARLYRVPEVWALRHDARRLGQLLVYSADDGTGAPLWLAESLALGAVSPGPYRQDNERPSLRSERFTVRLRGLRQSNPNLVNVTT